MRRSASLLAWGVFVAFVALTAASVVLEAATPGHATQPLELVLVLLAFVGIGGVGLFVAVRNPGNAIGWLLLAIVGGTAVGNFGQDYGAYGVTAGPGTLPGAVYAAWLGSAAWPVAIGLVLLVLQLFPDGKPLSPRWRALVWCTGLGLALFGAQFLFNPGYLDAGTRIRNPFGPAWMKVPALVAGGVGTALMLVVFVLAVVSVILRFRRSRGVERQQLKWFTYGAALMLVAILASGLWSAILPEWASGVPFVLALLSLPVTIGISILRYRLYDIDRVINRTLVYVALTGILAGVYAGLAVGLGSVAGSRANSVVIAGATLAVAALFRPVRRRTQGFIDRRFYRERYDAALTLEAFSARLRDQVDLDELRAHLEAVVQQTMRPASASLWLREPGP